LREGRIASGDVIIKKENGAENAPISRVLYLMKVGLKERAALEELVELNSLSAAVRGQFQKQLDKPMS